MALPFRFACCGVHIVRLLPLATASMYAAEVILGQTGCCTCTLRQHLSQATHTHTWAHTHTHTHGHTRARAHNPWHPTAQACTTTLQQANLALLSSLYHTKQLSQADNVMVVPNIEVLIRSQMTHNCPVRIQDLSGIGIQLHRSSHQGVVVDCVRGLPNSSSGSQGGSHGGSQVSGPCVCSCNVVRPVQGVILGPAPVVLVRGVVADLEIKAGV